MTRVGFTCAYTPLPLIDAAACEPYRILPSFSSAADRSGRVLHDNMCPQVKRILDRVMEPDLPELDGVVLVNSCDAMRRLADGWRQERPDVSLVFLDLPPTAEALGQAFFASELRRLWLRLCEWSGAAVDDEALLAALERHDQIAARLEELRGRLRAGVLEGGSAALQRVYNDVVSVLSARESLRVLDELLSQPPRAPELDGVPVLLFGNVMPDPAAFELLERCGARVVADDLCTGSRLIHPIERQPGEEPLAALSRGLMTRPACARTITAEQPGKLGADVVGSARRAGAKAVVAQVIKFCDPYLARVPSLRAACADAGLPLLLLEGDCTLRSVGQQTTRIEAFIEMIG